MPTFNYSLLVPANQTLMHRSDASGGPYKMLDLQIFVLPNPVFTVANTTVYYSRLVPANQTLMHGIQSIGYPYKILDLQIGVLPSPVSTVGIRSPSFRPTQ